MSKEKAPHGAGLRVSNALIAYNADSDEIRVGPILHAGEADWTVGYEMTTGASHLFVRDLKGIPAAAWICAEFITLTVADGVSARAAFKEFIKIEEFRRAMPEDVDCLTR